MEVTGIDGKDDDVNGGDPGPEGTWYGQDIRAGAPVPAQETQGRHFDTQSMISTPQ